MELRFENVTKNYKGKKVLKGISLTMGTGVYGLLGPNGAGKTTMIRILADVLRPTKGSVLYDGKDIHATATGRKSAICPRMSAFTATLPAGITWNIRRH